MEIAKINTKILYNHYVSKEKSPVSYKEFKSIITDFNKNVSKECLNGYKFQPVPRLGVLMIVLNSRIKRSKKYIDWKKTEKRKNEILSRGGTLYEEWWEVNGVRVILDKDKTIEQQKDKLEGAIKVNNKGEKWLIHFNDPFYFSWSWWNKTATTKFVKNITKYSFVPTRANKRAIKQIDKSNNPELVYGIHRKESKLSSSYSETL